jgi:hypothetical protein
MYPELIKSPISDGKKYYLKKRPGVAAGTTYSGTPQGIFYWAKPNIYLVAAGGTLYFNGTAILTLATSTGVVGFTEYDISTEDVLFVCDGTQAYTINGSGTVTATITSANGLPSPHIPAPVFLDGYIFLASANSQSINNSNLNDPTTWPADGFIYKEMFPDNVVWMTKAQNYLVGIGSASIEFFYDNANSTGSPLLPNAPAVAQFGCPAPQSVVQTEVETILIGSTDAGGHTVWTISGFQPTEIASEPVREALDLEGTSLTQATGFCVQCSGHKWYVMNLVGNSRTFVYDFDEQMWHEWSSGTTQQYFQWAFAADSGNGSPMLLSATSGQTGVLSPTNYTDLGNAINCEVITSKLDFDTIMRKRIFRLSLIGDAPNANNNVPLTLNWSDDDYNTWVGGLTIEMSGDYPTVTQLGYTRRRAFQFIYQQPYPLRLEAFEVDIIQEVRR